MAPLISALITEGTHGLGKQFALNLLRIGANVTVLGKNEKAGMEFTKYTNKQFNRRLYFMKCDIQNSDQLNDAFEKCNKKHGPMNIICNNVCGYSADEVSISDQITKNLVSLIEGTYKGLDLMSVKNGGKGGLIINVPSIEFPDDFKRATINRATKFGLVGFTRSFKDQRQLEIDNIRVNCLCPIFALPLSEENDENEEQAEQSGMTNSIEYERYDNMLDALIACMKNKEMNGEVIVARVPIRQP